MRPSCVSLVLVTYNRAAALAETLAHFEHCSTPSDVCVEFVIVDNNSNDTTKSVVAAFAQRSRVPVVPVFERRQGEAYARNAGIRQSRGDLIVTVDDDIIPAREYLLQIVAEFERHDRPVVIGGRVELWDPKHKPFTIMTDRDDRRLTETMNPAGFLLGCNMAFNRAIMDRIGLFDTRFGVGTSISAGAETDFFYRAFLAGFEVLYSPRFVVFHNHGRTTDEQIAKVDRGYMISEGALRLKYLLAGDGAMARRVYWDSRAILRSLIAPRPGIETRSHALTRVRRFIVGAARYLASGGDKSAA